jgi:zona occludens toxin
VGLVINLLLGAPGGGKSYEATVYHILKAVTNGRKVITNLPLNVEYFDAIEPGSSELIELRSDRLNLRAFATPADYGDAWRHPDSGAGPLYVIDECHRAMPRGETLREVEEWFAEHRHERADVLLLTQSYGKVSKSVVDLVQIVYRVRKNVALGSSTSYTRKVQDGVRGAVMNTAIRRYDPKFFALYTSHTKSSEYGSELQAQDIRPIWRHWSVYGFGVCLVITIYLGAQGHLNPFASVSAAPVSDAEAIGSASNPYELKTPTPVAAPLASAPSGEAVPPPPPPEPAPDLPFGNLTFQVVGMVESSDRSEIWLAAQQGAQSRFRISATDLREAGYQVKRITHCAVLIQFGTWQAYATCAGQPLRIDIPSPL